jgi:hypothetical protein
LVHFDVAQSSSTAHDAPGEQGAHLVPPQSTSVSAPSRAALEQLAGTGTHRASVPSSSQRVPGVQGFTPTKPSPSSPHRATSLPWHTDSSSRHASSTQAPVSQNSEAAQSRCALQSAQWPSETLQSSPRGVQSRSESQGARQ